MVKSSFETKSRQKKVLHDESNSIGAFKQNLHKLELNTENYCRCYHGLLSPVRLFSFSVFSVLCQLIVFAIIIVRSIQIHIPNNLNIWRFR